jgi:hypothetical protein
MEFAQVQNATDGLVESADAFSFREDVLLPLMC